MPDTVQEWHAEDVIFEAFLSILQAFWPPKLANSGLKDAPQRRAYIRSLPGSHRWTCPRHARVMPAPRPRHTSQTMAYSPRHARAMPAPRARHCPVTPAMDWICYAMHEIMSDVVQEWHAEE
eukprot:gene14062-biopygen17070